MAISKSNPRTSVFVSQKAAYYSATNFQDHDLFVPERWLPNSGYESDRKDVMQAFSYGPRNCLGKKYVHVAVLRTLLTIFLSLAYHEMHIIFATVLWHFDLELCSESESWIDQKVYTLWSKPELWVKFRPVH